MIILLGGKKALPPFDHGMKMQSCTIQMLFESRRKSLLTSVSSPATQDHRVTHLLELLHRSRGPPDIAGRGGTPPAVFPPDSSSLPFAAVAASPSWMWATETKVRVVTLTSTLTINHRSHPSCYHHHCLHHQHHLHLNHDSAPTKDQKTPVV